MRDCRAHHPAELTKALFAGLASFVAPSRREWGFSRPRGLFTLDNRVFRFGQFQEAHLRPLRLFLGRVPDDPSLLLCASLEESL